MKRPPLPYLLLRPLLVVLLFGNCSQNVYCLLGPGPSPAQVARLRELDHNAAVAPPPDSFWTARRRPGSVCFRLNSTLAI